MQLFLFCLLGTIIEDKGVKFAAGVYSLTWNELSKQDKQIFRLLLLSSQQPQTLTCAGMTCISLNLFVNVRIPKLGVLTVCLMCPSNYRCRKSSTQSS